MLRRCIQLRRSLSGKPIPKTPSSKSSVPTNAAAPPLISCKVKKFNLSRADKLHPAAKFGTLDLASSGWMHHKAKGDFFTIHPVPNHHKAPQDLSPPLEPRLFTKFGLDARIERNLVRNLNLHECSYAQYEGIPHILAGDHTLIAAETGCGKTLSYLVPVVQQILQRKESEAETGGLKELNTPLGLVLTPGRELGNLFNLFDT